MTVRWETDPELRVRMGASLVLVVVVPFALVYAAVFLSNTVGIWLLRIPTSEAWNGEFYVEPWLVGGPLLACLAAGYVRGEWRALRSIDASRVDESEHRDLQETLDRLASAAGAPTPDLAVADAAAPNAFAVGRRPSKATVVVTTGLLEVLDEEELEAVLAHEVAHVENGDVSVMTTTYFLTSLARPVASLALFGVLSRHREYQADLGAVAITGKAAPLASALETLDDRLADLPDEDRPGLDGGVEAVSIVPIGDDRENGGRGIVPGDLLPSAHPAIEDRIDRLEAYMMEEET